MSREPDRERVLDLRSFHDLKANLPATKMGAIVTLLPEIQGLQRQGRKTRAIWESLTNDGFQMTYDLFRLYLGIVFPWFNIPGWLDGHLAGTQPATSSDDSADGAATAMPTLSPILTHLIVVMRDSA